MAQAIDSYTTSRFPNFSNEALADGGGCASVHPLHGPELRALRPLHGRRPIRLCHRSGHTSNHGLVLTNGPANRARREASLPGPSPHA